MKPDCAAFTALRHANAREERESTRTIFETSKIFGEENYFSSKLIAFSAESTAKSLIES